MSDEKSRRDKMSLPPEAKRRGGMDTLFSAAWFDDAPEKPAGAPEAAAPAAGAKPGTPAAEPEKGSSTFLILALVGGGLLFGAVLCSGLGIGVGAYVYVIGN